MGCLSIMMGVAGLFILYGSFAERWWPGMTLGAVLLVIAAVIEYVSERQEAEE